MTSFGKILIALCAGLALFSHAVLADVINQENLKTHLRWNLSVPRDQFFIVKKEQNLVIETVNLEVFEKLSKELAGIKLNAQYIEGISYSKENFPARPATITVKLKDQTVELFSFYRDVDKKYILDFWINNDMVVEKPVEYKKPLPLPKQAPKKTVKKDSDIQTELLSKRTNILPLLEVKENDPNGPQKNPEYRDFRYGASFIWDYQPMIPQMEKDINLMSKTPDFLYPIQDRTNIEDEKEAHLQLTINLYREGKYGLMNKSMSLYDRKYGRDSNYLLNEYIKANALIRGNLAKPNKGITQSAMILLSNIKDLSKDYEFKAAVLRYLIQYHLDIKDHIKSLSLAKELYVEARGEFDQNLIIQSAMVILHSLAELRQVDKIAQFLSENKKIDSILPPQMSFAYLSFAMLLQGDTKELIKRYRAVEKSLVKPIHPAILFNVAESFFRTAEYEMAIKLYDEFLASYSYLLQSPHARLRMALAFEILDRPASENLVLYKNAIDRSTSPEIRYEAKLRYVAMRLARKLKPTDEDKEVEVFLEQSPDESKALNQNLKKLLWLVRLRLLISTKEYDKALAYLTSLPLDAIKPSERRVFEGDGAEIINGIIQEAYIKEDYAKAVKAWEVYKDKYESKVAKNLFMNFVVCESFLKLGLYKSYDRALASFKNIQLEEKRNFPLWVDRLKKTNINEMIEELNIIRLIAEAKWVEAEAKLTTYPVSLRDSLNYPYYQGIIHFNQKRFKEASLEFENVLVKQNSQNQLTPRQTADLLMGYVESLYQLKDHDRFKTIVKALKDDISKSKSAPILNISERINYLLIETYVGESNPEWKELEIMTKNFRENFQKSPYSARVGYLYGLSLIKNSKSLEGREVFKILTNDSSVPGHIKEMCKTELATLELIEKKL